MQCILFISICVVFVVCLFFQVSWTRYIHCWCSFCFILYGSWCLWCGFRFHNDITCLSLTGDSSSSWDIQRPAWLWDDGCHGEAHDEFHSKKRQSCRCKMVWKFLLTDFCAVFHKDKWFRCRFQTVFALHCNFFLNYQFIMLKIIKVRLVIKRLCRYIWR